MIRLVWFSQHKILSTRSNTNHAVCRTRIVHSDSFLQGMGPSFQGGKGLWTLILTSAGVQNSHEFAGIALSFSLSKWSEKVVNTLDIIVVHLLFIRGTMTFKTPLVFPFGAQQKKDEKLFKGNGKGGTTARRSEQITHHHNAFSTWNYLCMTTPASIAALAYLTG